MPQDPATTRKSIAGFPSYRGHFWDPKSINIGFKSDPKVIVSYWWLLVDRQTDIHNDRTDRQTYRHTDVHTDRQTDKPTSFSFSSSCNKLQHEKHRLKVSSGCLTSLCFLYQPWLVILRVTWLLHTRRAHPRWPSHWRAHRQSTGHMRLQPT